MIERQSLDILISVIEQLMQEVAIAIVELDRYQGLKEEVFNNYQQLVDTQNLGKRDLEEQITKITQRLENVESKQESFSRFESRVSSSVNTWKWVSVTLPALITFLFFLYERMG